MIDYNNTIEELENEDPFLLFEKIDGAEQDAGSEREPQKSGIPGRTQ